jgi:hypothetical protein
VRRRRKCEKRGVELPKDFNEIRSFQRPSKTKNQDNTSLDNRRTPFGDVRFLLGRQKCLSLVVNSSPQPLRLPPCVPCRRSLRAASPSKSLWAARRSITTCRSPLPKVSVTSRMKDLTSRSLIFRGARAPCRPLSAAPQMLCQALSSTPCRCKPEAKQCRHLSCRAERRSASLQ